ncbi:MAG: DUF1588 domain-containing protein, partial [Myxococcota bacterium]|nr:DUF1588 domain-containing protein [Myxococcota bacterium]
DDDAPVRAIGQWATAIAAARGGLAPTTVEAYEGSAREIVRYVFADAARRDALLSGGGGSACVPAAVEGDPCTREVLARVGRRAFRRPLGDDELRRWSALSASIGGSLGDPQLGLEHALTGLLQSPHFLYRVEIGEDDPAAPAVGSGAIRIRYASHELATRLAYLLWSSTPDDALLDAAETGELLTDDGLDAAIDRMVSDPRAAAGIEAFLSDLLEVDALRTVEKDPMVFPGFEAFSASLAPQLVRTASASVTRGGLPGLFTSHTTYVDAPLAPLYGLDPAAYGAELSAIELDAASPRAGILTTPGLLAMHSYPGKTSVALRGLFVRRRLLCQSIPPPPPEVDTQLPDVEEGMLVTTRELVAIHQREPICASCHAFMDPIGLALEHFDADGSHRETHNGLPIDASGELDGVPFEDAEGLARALAEHPAFVPCVASQVFASAVGSTVSATDPEMQRLADASSGDLLALMGELARSSAFRYAWRPRAGATP